jgi:hypothetical protein
LCLCLCLCSSSCSSSCHLFVFVSTKCGVVGGQLSRSPRNAKVTVDKCTSSWGHSKTHGLVYTCFLHPRLVCAQAAGQVRWSTYRRAWTRIGSVRAAGRATQGPGVPTTRLSRCGLPGDDSDTSTYLIIHKEGACLQCLATQANNLKWRHRTRDRSNAEGKAKT